IAEVTARTHLPIRHEPIAYLLAPGEANQDATNYWVFSQAGLERLLSRTGWDICDYVTTGCTRKSEPASSSRDQRVFYLLRSRLADPWCQLELVRGWHEMEEGSWRWTERDFSVRLSARFHADAMLRFRFVLPEQAIAGNNLGLILSATVNGHRLQASQFSSAGEWIYEQFVPRALLRDESALIEFTLNHAIAPTRTDQRELGVIVRFCGKEEDPRRCDAPVELVPVS
ncbi:MAG: hypothetical protein ACRD96_25725, partial [Bryobacteraceae bacterium]